MCSLGPETAAACEKCLLRQVTSEHCTGPLCFQFPRADFSEAQLYLLRKVSHVVLSSRACSDEQRMFQDIQALGSRAMESWEGVWVGQAIELLLQFPPVFP